MLTFTGDPPNTIQLPVQPSFRGTDEISLRDIANINVIWVFKVRDSNGDHFTKLAFTGDLRLCVYLMTPSSEMLGCYRRIEILQIQINFRFSQVSI